MNVVNKDGFKFVNIIRVEEMFLWKSKGIFKKRKKREVGFFMKLLLIFRLGYLFEC